MLKEERKLDPRVIRTRHMLREALMSLIPEMGYDAITVKHITDRATLNRATFYLHYQDKHELLTQIMADVLDELAATTLTRPLPTATDVRQVFIYLFNHVAKHKPFYRVMLEEPSVASYVQDMQKHMEEIGMRWLSSAQFPTQDMLTPPSLFISFIGSAYLGVIRWWVLSDEVYSADYMAIQFVRLAIGGLQSDFGIRDTLVALEDELRQTHA